MKKVEIVIIKIPGEGILRQKVLKALANPPRIFYVPYSLAVLNFLVWFLLFVVFMVITLILPPHEIPMWAPLIFLGVLTITHMILGFYSKQDQQMAQIIMSSFSIFKNKIPRKLVV